MSDTAAPDYPLPPLRQEIALYEGGRKKNGSPTWILEDKLSGKFFKIGWEEFEIIARWAQGTRDKLLNALHEQTTLNTSEGKISSLIGFLRENGLLGRLETPLPPPKKADLFNKVLFYKRSLFKPDKFLDATYPYLAPFMNRRMLVVVIMLALLGLFLISREFSYFMATVPFLKTFNGSVGLFITLALTQSLHELGHAYAAKKYGLPVRSLGVSLIMFVPLLYSDTTNAWRLKDRNARLSIGLAGIMTELTLAAIASIVWALADDGPIKSGAFLLAGVTWISSVVVNLNPLMRFDGYYLMSDITEFDNLQQRATLYTRWVIRKCLCRYDAPPPEHLSKKARIGVVTYGVAGWIYRFSLYLGISVGVYHLFFKTLGIAMMMYAVYSMLVKPLVMEFKAIATLSKKQGFSKANIALISSLITLVIFIFLVPWQSKIESDGILQYKNHTVLYPVEDAYLTSLPVKNGQAVKEGDVIASLYSDSLLQEIAQNDIEIADLRAQIARMRSESKFLMNRLSLEEELMSRLGAGTSLQARLESLQVKAPISGIIRDIPPDMHEGRWLGKTTPIGTIIDPSQKTVFAFVHEQDLARIHIGAKAAIMLSQSRKTLHGEVISIAPSAIDVLSEPSLAAVHGGPIPVDQNRMPALYPKDALYMVEIAPTETIKSDHLVLVSAYIDAERKSLLSRVVVKVLSVILREGNL